MFNKPIKPKYIGLLMLIPASLILFGAIAASFIVPSFAFASGGGFLMLIPFLFVMLLVFSCSIFCIYVSVCYFKNKPFKENKSLGSIFVFFSLGYFAYTLLVCLLSNLTGNMGGYGQPIFAFLILLILLPLGLGMRNGYQS